MFPADDKSILRLKEKLEIALHKLDSFPKDFLLLVR